MEGIITAFRKSSAATIPPVDRNHARMPLRPRLLRLRADHWAETVNLRKVTDTKGQDDIDPGLAHRRAEKPIHVSIVGGEPSFVSGS